MQNSKISSSENNLVHLFRDKTNASELKLPLKDLSNSMLNWTETNTLHGDFFLVQFNEYETAPYFT